MGCLEDRRRQESHGGDHATPGQTLLSWPPAAEATFYKAANAARPKLGQDGVLYHPRKIERDIFSVLSFTAPHITGSVQID